jgi:hypothetical protein
MKKINKKDFLDLRNKKELIKEIKSSINLCYRGLKKKNHYVALLCLIVCGIDGLSAKGEKSKYINALKKYFPDLCKELGALEFYNKYRNGIVHEFSFKKGYAIAENHEVNGKYLGEITMNNKKYIGLNMDRLTEDFLNYLKKTDK